jgi:hypothetical protein
MNLMDILCSLMNEYLFSGTSLENKVTQERNAKLEFFH